VEAAGVEPGELGRHQSASDVFTITCITRSAVCATRVPFEHSPSVTALPAPVEENDVPIQSAPPVNAVRLNLRITPTFRVLGLGKAGLIRARSYRSARIPSRQYTLALKRANKPTGSLQLPESAAGNYMASTVRALSWCENSKPLTDCRVRINRALVGLFHTGAYDGRRRPPPFYPE
jgi:hypothetical protein